jgi:peptidoglycan/LPS O-acetylase OafA/YrhL
LDVDYQNPIINLVEAFFSTCLVAMIVTRPNGISWLRSPILVWLGNISFSVYLIHFPLMSCLAWLLYRHLGIGAVPTFGGAMLLAVLTALITLPLASLCYRYVERPGISAGRGLLDLLHRGAIGQIRSTPAQKNVSG